MFNIKRNKKTKTTKKTASSYWLSGWETSGIVHDSLSVEERKTHDLYKLSAAKRAIGNFVTIVTKQKIPVEFNVHGKSYTDGKSVVIGTEVQNPSDFDVVVGLALHEGSHIKLSDFDLLKRLQDEVPQNTINKAVKLGINNWHEVVKDILNVVEDRRIDSYIFNSAPGYRDYYRAMYDKFFNSPIIDVGLMSDAHREENVDAYMHRIINIHNKNTDLTALNGLQEIFNLINLKKIDRIKTTYQAWEIAQDIFDVMLENITDKSDYTSESQPGDGDGNGDGGDQELSDKEFQDLLDAMDGEAQSGNGNGSGTPAEIDGDMGGSPGKGTSNGKKPIKIKLTKKQKKILEKKIKQQKKFLDGNTNKSTLSDKQGSEIEQIDHSGSEMKNVAKDFKKGHGSFKGVNVIVANKMTKKLMMSDVFPMASRHYSDNSLQLYYQNEIDKGVRIGKILGKKLQLRGESRNTVYNRQKLGRIDKRMIASLGFGNENVFEFTDVDTYKKANLHISIDASSSMGGSKWNQTLTNVTALCKAVDMIANLEIQVSFRTTTNGLPYVVLAYDSRTDKFSKVRQLFPALETNGTTPEGLCFEAIMKDFLEATADTDSYFLNISDGEPYYPGANFYYSDSPAFEHTRKMVKKIESMGIKTLSYYVDDYSSRVSSGFKRMYGEGAHAIDVTNVSQITRTMNKLYMNKK